MKLSKSLLQAMLVGVTVATTTLATSSCNLVDELKDEDRREVGQCTFGGGEVLLPNENAVPKESCPACGMG